MKFFRIILVLLFLAFFGIGCASSPWWYANNPSKTTDNPQLESSWGYHPLDPLPVYLWCKGTHEEDYGRSYDSEVVSREILDLLPDEAMRIAIGEVTKGGNIIYGPAKAGIKGNTYVVVLDYTKSTVDYFNFYSDGSCPSAEDERKAAKSGIKKGQKMNVPMYVGVGLRLTANITVNEGSLDLGNLIALGAAAQAKQVSGTMAIQALGITGPGISTLIPMPSEINASTIQNALLNLGAIKAKIYDTGTTVSPRVVGVYNKPGEKPDTINSLISCILERGGIPECQTRQMSQRAKAGSEMTLPFLLS